MISISATDLATLNSGGTVSVVGPAPVVVAPPPPPPPPVPVTGFPQVKIAAGKLVDGAGAPLRLKGVNISGMEYAYIQGWSKGFPADPFCGQAGASGLNIPAMKAWGINAVRLPLNAASINGVQTYDANGAARSPDPLGNYMANVKSLLDAFYAAGIYVVVDPLHWAAPLLTVPGQVSKVPFSPMGQGPAPDAGTCVPAIKRISTLLKNYPNTILDPFNEWMANSYGEVAGVTDQWAYWRDGGAMYKFDNNTTGGSNYDFVQPWTACGMQTLVTAARDAGFTGPILLGGISWDGDDSGWLGYRPVDPLQQLMASLHVYPAYGTAFGSVAYNAMPTARFDVLKAIQAAGYPVMLGEVGGHDVAGTAFEPFTQGVLDWAVANNVSYFGWAWNTWANGDNVLIKDGAGTPTDGFGAVFKAHA